MYLFDLRRHLHQIFQLNGVLQTKKTQKSFSKSIENWPFGRKIRFFGFFGAILNFDAILDFPVSVLLAQNILRVFIQQTASKNK
jgi:hypothetical protein